MATRGHARGDAERGAYRDRSPVLSGGVHTAIIRRSPSDGRYVLEPPTECIGCVRPTEEVLNQLGGVGRTPFGENRVAVGMRRTRRKQVGLVEHREQILRNDQ